MKIAMWSGPRNLSTAMLYAFGNRADCAAWDEPFYAAYLADSGIDHPMRDEVLAAHETDPEAITALIQEPNLPETPHLYMKHMAFHMLEGFPLDWAADCVNVHLIRHPARVVASYVAKRENPTLEDLGFRQQMEIYDRFLGPVIDSADIRADPEAMLQMLCAEIGLPFDPAMLSWPAGPKPWDGAWAPHWYGAVHRSTGFDAQEVLPPDVSAEHTTMLAEAEEVYRQLSAQKLAVH